MAWTAIYSRQEIETLISDERIPQDRRTLYGILVLAGVRYGGGGRAPLAPPGT